MVSALQHYSQASYVKTQLKWTLWRRSPWEWVTGKYCDNATKGKNWGILHSNRTVLLGQNSLWFFTFWSEMSVYFFFFRYLVYIWFLYFVIIYLFFFNLLFSIFWSSISILLFLYYYLRGCTCLDRIFF